MGIRGARLERRNCWSAHGKLDAELHRRIRKDDWPSDQRQARRLATSYHHNRHELREPLTEGVQRVDFLCEMTEFVGLDQGPELLMDQTNVKQYSNTFSLVCESRIRYTS